MPKIFNTIFIRATKRFKRIASWPTSPPSLPNPKEKQKALLALAKTYGLRILVETGTYFGDTIDSLQRDFEKIISIELSQSLFEQAKARFSHVPHVNLFCGDSGQILKSVLPTLDKPTLFWLDAHYSGGVLRGGFSARGDVDTPIIAELGHILSSSPNKHVIVIDDAHLFGIDPAYPTIKELNKFIHSWDHSIKIIINNNMIYVIQ
jgi:hypothetical protein